MNLPKALRKVARLYKSEAAASMFNELADELEQQQKDEDERDNKLRNDLDDLLDPH